MVKNHILFEMAENPNATRKTMYRSLSQDYRPVLPVRLQVRLLHRYRKTRLMILHRVQQQHDVEVPAVHHWEASDEIPQKPKTNIKMRTPYRHREIDCAICQNGQRSSRKIQKTKESPTILRVSVLRMLTLDRSIWSLFVLRFCGGNS